MLLTPQLASKRFQKTLTMMVPSSEVTSQNQTQPQTCGSSEPSFADVVRMTTTIQFCDSRCPIAIEKLIADVDKYRKIAEFSDITSNLVLQLRCSSEILDLKLGLKYLQKILSPKIAVDYEKTLVSATQKLENILLNSSEEQMKNPLIRFTALKKF